MTIYCQIIDIQLFIEFFNLLLTCQLKAPFTI